MKNTPKRKMSLNATDCLALVVSLVLTSCGAVGTESKGIDVNRKNECVSHNEDAFFSGWVLKSGSGKTIDLGEILTGEVVVVSFFASYCTKCKKKLVDHQLLWEKYQQRGLSVLGVSVDEPETQSDVGIYARNRGLTYPVVIDTESKIVNQLNPRRTLPFTVIVDRRGSVLWNHVGYAPGDEKLVEEQVVKAISDLETSGPDARNN